MTIAIVLSNPNVTNWGESPSSSSRVDQAIVQIRFGAIGETTDNSSQQPAGHYANSDEHDGSRNCLQIFIRADDRGPLQYALKHLV
jgi:hypothetical protein